MIAPLVISACGGGGSKDADVVGKVSGRADESSMVDEFEVGKVWVRAHPSATVATSASASVDPSATPRSGPRAWDIEKDALRMHIVDRPGMLVDGNAPPPPPGQPLSPHPFLSGSCNNDAMGCVEAGKILRDSKSTDEFISRLGKAGFIVKSGPP